MAKDKSNKINLYRVSCKLNSESFECEVHIIEVKETENSFVVKNEVFGNRRHPKSSLGIIKSAYRTGTFPVFHIMILNLKSGNFILILLLITLKKIIQQNGIGFIHQLAKVHLKLYLTNK